MKQVDAPTAVSLTALQQGAGVVVALTDSRRVSMLEFVALSPAQRDELNAATRHAATAARRGAGDAAAACSLGQRLFEALLPSGVRQRLRDSPPRTLWLQLDRGLAWVPWELAFDGENFLGDKFRVHRQVVADEPLSPQATTTPRAECRVLVLSGGSGAALAPELVARLRAAEGAAVSTGLAHALGRDEVLALMADSDVVHYLGPTDTDAAPGGVACWWRLGEMLELDAIAALATPPRLLISQHAADPSAALSPAGAAPVAAAASERGLTMLAIEHAGDVAAIDFVTDLYRGLLDGAAIGEALRAARVELHRRHGIVRVLALQPQLYGDGDLVLRPRERQAHADDAVRQLTVMSFDLVESTRLLAALGAERYSELLAEYHRRSARILEARGGTPDDPQGDDGTMCYFGFPVAREDAALQAMRAGFELVDAVQSLGLAVRVGVCTGQVVVRDGQPVGAAIHFAARLQALAAPGTLVVGESTRRIVKDHYRFQPIETVARLKGFDQPESIYVALGAARPRDDDAGVAPPLPTPFVGRERELQALDSHWAAAQGGALRLVRLVGDAGIGKSRLLGEFKRRLVARGVEVFECRCTPDDARSAYRPLIAALRRQIGAGDADDGHDPGERLRRLVAPVTEDVESGVLLLAELLSLPPPAREPRPATSPERKRQLTLELLVALASARARRAPTCMLVEDIHWIDPSTAELLNRVALGARELPLLVVVTARTDAEAPWHPRVAVHEAELRPLSPELSRALVLGACGDARLPGEVVHLIAARADGVPLFIEESTRMLVERAAGGAALDAAAALEVPATLLDLLTARLDRLAGAKPIAQVGAAIGRDFPHALLHAVLAHPDCPFALREPDVALAELLRSGLLFARTEGAEIRYTFKHALVRDAAYRSLLERDRRRLHQVVAQVIGDRFADLAAHQPELLALHHTEAGNDAEALRLWEAAARLAASRSAHAEAISHLGAALSLLQRAEPGATRDRAELRLQLLLAARLIATDGYGADRVERVYARALELASALGDDAARLKVLLGLEGYHFMRADFAQALVHSAQAQAMALRLGSAIHAIQARWAEANVRMHRGELADAVVQMDRVLADYDRLEHRAEAVQDPGVMCLCYSAWSTWQLGRPDEALARADDVVARAERLRHKFSIGEAYGFRAAVQHFRGESAAALASAQRAVQVCEDGGFAVWLAHALVMRGRAAAALGDVEAGVAEMRRGCALWSATGAIVTTPFYLAMRAEGEMLAGRDDDAWQLLEHALAIVERTGERYYEAEIRRLLGVLTLHRAAAAGVDRSAEAHACLHRAHQVASALQLRSLVLRSAITHAELWLAQGVPGAALALLQPALNAVGEGRDTRDPRRARQLLAAARAAAASAAPEQHA